MKLCSTDLSGFLCTPHLKDGGSKSLGDKVGELSSHHLNYVPAPWTGAPKLTRY